MNTWDQLDTYSWDDFQTWDQLIPSVVADISLVFRVKDIAGVDLAAKFNVYQHVNASLESRYNVNSKTFAELETVFNISSLTGFRTLEMIWDVYSIVNIDVETLSSVLTTVSKELEFGYDVLYNLWRQYPDLFTAWVEVGSPPLTSWLVSQKIDISWLTHQAPVVSEWSIKTTSPSVWI